MVIDNKHNIIRFLFINFIQVGFTNLYNLIQIRLYGEFEPILL